MDEEWKSPKFQQKLNRFYKSIKSKIGDPITETYIEKFEVEIIPYEDATFQEIKLSEPEALMLDQDDSPNQDKGGEYISMEVLLTRLYRY